MASRQHDPPEEEMGNAGGVKPKMEQQQEESVLAPTAGVKREAEEVEEESVAAPTAGVKREAEEEEEKKSMAAPTAGVKREAAEEEHGAPMASRRRVDPDLTTTPPSHESMIRMSRELVEAMGREFADKPDRLEEFNSMLSDFSDPSIDKYGAFDRIQAVFDGHPNLIDRFNEIMLMGYKIAVQLGAWD